MSYRKEEYDAYLFSDRWLLELKPQRLVIDNHRCRMCDAKATEVHHRRYPNIYGTETVDDLTSLCRTCHKNYHYPPSMEVISRQIMGQAKKKVIKCPCCYRPVKFHKRTLTSAMAVALIHICRYFDRDDAEEWLHIEDYLKDLPIGASIRGDVAKLAHFKTLAGEPLLLSKIALRPDGSDRNGYWKITGSSKAFIEGRVKVPKFVRLYRNLVADQSGEYIDIKQALRNKFNYEDLLNG